EMEKLEKVVKPTIGVLTGIGPAHDEGFSSASEKVIEKLKLFANSEILILQKAPIVNGLVHQKTFSWSFDDKTADVLISTDVLGNRTNLNLDYRNAFMSIEIPFRDAASIENAISCLMVLLYLNYDEATIQARMS